ncbi:MAG: hypothetical protein PVG11_05910 [Anaerolineae bacterium]
MENFDLQQLELFLYLLIGLVFVTLFGLILYTVIANRRERRRLAEAYEVEQLTPRPTLQMTGQILSLVRKRPADPLHVEVAGHRYRRMADVQDPLVRRQIVEAAMELIQFTGVLSGEIPPAPAPAAKTYRWREDLRQDSLAELQRIRAGEEPSPGPDQVPEDVEESFLDLLSEMSTGGSAERATLVSALQRTMQPRRTDTEGGRTFLDEIDAIIQRRIQLIPALSQRELRVRQAPGGVVHFVFEGKVYENMDEIPNLTARQVVIEAIQEWDETA